MRSFVVAALALLPLLAALPVQAEVGVLPVVVRGFDPVEGDRSEQLNTNARRVMKERYRAVTPKKAGCEESKPCRVELVKGDIEELAVIILEKTGPDSARMELRVFDASGDRILRLTRDLAFSEATSASTALLTQAFDPAHYSGKLEVRGMPAGAELFVDGLSAPPSGAALAVGQHQLVVRQDNGEIFKSRVGIQFGTTSSVDVVDATAQAPRAPDAWSPWPSIVAGGGVLAGIGVAVAVATVGSVALSDSQRGQLASLLAGATSHTADEDPSGNKYNTGYGTSSEQKSAAVAMVAAANDARALRSFEQQRGAIPIIVVASAGVAAVSAVACAVTLFTGHE